MGERRAALSRSAGSAAKDCPHSVRQPVRIRKGNGLEEVKLLCSRCGDLEAGHRLRDYDLSLLPLYRNHSGKNPPCEVCSAPNTELHHYAPTALFGSDANRWPKGWLCRDCHTRWHRTINAGVHVDYSSTLPPDHPGRRGDGITT